MGSVTKFQFKQISGDLMTNAEIHTKLEEGFEDIEAGRVQDAKAAFAAFRESHR